MTVVTADEIIEEEMVWGARRRERLWMMVAAAGVLAGVLGMAAGATVLVTDVDPPPELVPFDPETGMALPEAKVETVTITERPAVIEAQVYRYVLDRETYNQLDNDLRIRRALAQSRGSAEESLRRMWSRGNDLYPPTRYGEQAELDVEIDSITLVAGGRAQVRMRKRLRNEHGVTTGLFTATLAFGFDPEEPRSLDEVWQNPFGFHVTQYAVRSDRAE